MADVSVFDIFKIGIGPSSSHTLGPWKAADRFVRELEISGLSRIKVRLFGSLAKTGRGHGTDIAVMMGLESHDPATYDTTLLKAHIDQIKREQQIRLQGVAVLRFDHQKDIMFENSLHPAHPNTLIFEALYEDGITLTRVFCSVGGGFIEEWTGSDDHVIETIIREGSIESGSDLLAICDITDQAISEVVFTIEEHYKSPPEINDHLDLIWDTMLSCIYRGCNTEGRLPGGLNVKRRAAEIMNKLCPEIMGKELNKWFDHLRLQRFSFQETNKLVSCFALAVNEENADFGRVVTSPTNGAAGVIPAVLLHYLCTEVDAGRLEVRKLLLTAGQIGILFKKGATISAAVGGCQAEIGVSSAMAAGGLTAVLGGSPRQVLMAAEIAMEHHLGLTCDPIGGLVQVPCIERNAMGAMKAITAAHLALESDPTSAIVDLDAVIRTMWQTAQDMNHKYKETSDGGLAIQLPVILPDC